MTIATARAVSHGQHDIKYAKMYLNVRKANSFFYARLIVDCC
jgi:hypothetical protein